jgi:lipopolysaccharide export system permease protein
MILFRYLAHQIFRGSLLVLLILVSLGIFFELIRELDDLGSGQYDIPKMLQYLGLKIPTMAVEFMPLAVLLGSILSLGSLASGSEIIALQAGGMSLRKLLFSVSSAGLIVALVTLLVADFVVPYSETGARELRSSSIASRASIRARKGVWIKDESNIIHIHTLYPNGNATGIRIFHLDETNQLRATTLAQSAYSSDQGWQLQQVTRSSFEEELIRTENLDSWQYQGALGESLLGSMATNPRQMSLQALSTYVTFLKRNNLSYDAESLSFWLKLYSPLAIIVMAVLAIPFILGSQRQANTGQRVLIGIMLGLLYIVLNRLLIQLGQHFDLVPAVNALLPTLCFIAITFALLRKKLANS